MKAMWQFPTRLFAIFAILMASSTAFSDETIVIINGEWPPFTSKNLKYYGVSSHVVTEAFALAGITVKYKFYPWARGGEMVKTGKMGGITLIYTKTPAREKYAVYSEPMLVAETMFFHLKSVPFSWQSMGDLQGLKIGGTLSYNYGKAFTAAENAKKIIVERVSTDILSIKKLLRGRIDAFPMAIDVGHALINQELPVHEAQQITYHPKPLISQHFHLLISKKNKDHKRLIRSFNKGLKMLKDSGKFDQYHADARRGEYDLVND